MCAQAVVSPDCSILNDPGSDFGMFEGACSALGSASARWGVTFSSQVMSLWYWRLHGWRSFLKYGSCKLCNCHTTGLCSQVCWLCRASVWPAAMLVVWCVKFVQPSVLVMPCVCSVCGCVESYGSVEVCCAATQCWPCVMSDRCGQLCHTTVSHNPVG